MRDQCAQELPDAVPMGLAQDLRGQRFGALVAIERVGNDARATRWLLECDCGRFALRRAGHLIQSRKLGHEPCCNVCLRELQSGRSIAREDYRGSFIRQAYEATGSLYGADYDEKFVGACLGELGLEPGDAPPSAAELATAGGETPRCAGHGSMLFPISCVGGWPCLHCGKVFTDGFGCVECVEPVCPECVDEHSGRLAPDASMTLAAIGLYLGITRERVRQWEARALRKLRHPSRSKLLVEYANPDHRMVVHEIERVHDPLKLETRHCGVTLSQAGQVIYCSRCGTTMDWL